MKKFRKVWLVIVILLSILFAAYRYMEMQRIDTSGPVISGGGDTLEVSIRDGEDVLLKGITAEDKKDGDVTSSLIVEKISNFYGDNRRTVTYAAFDSDNHIAKVEREIIYKDYVSPRFELTGSLRFRSGENINIDQIVTATDCLDGDLSSKVKIHMETYIDNRTTGFYQIVYEVKNSAGDSVLLPISIEVYEPISNEVTLNLEQYLVYYTGQEIDFTKYLKNVQIGNREYTFTDQPISAEEAEEAKVVPISRVRISSQADYTTPGVYPVYFYYTEENERYTSEGTEVMYIVVEK